MRWPLSTNFDKLISRTADKGKSQYTLPSTGLLLKARMLNEANNVVEQFAFTDISVGGRIDRAMARIPEGKAYVLPLYPCDYGYILPLPQPYGTVITPGSRCCTSVWPQ